MTDPSKMVASMPAVDLEAQYDCLHYEGDDGGPIRALSFWHHGAHCRLARLTAEQAGDLLTLRCRVRMREPSCRLEIRSDSPDGPVVGVLTGAGAASGWTTVEVAVYLEAREQELYLFHASARCMSLECHWFDWRQRSHGDLVGLKLGQVVPPLGPPQQAFIGGGRMGLGLAVDGSWDYLIGPHYGKASLIDALQSRVLLDDTAVADFSPGLRLDGAPCVIAIALVGDVTIHQIDVAPLDADWAGRFLVIDARRSTADHRLDWSASISPAQERHMLWQHQQGSWVEELGGGAVRLVHADGHRCTCIGIGGPTTATGRLGQQGGDPGMAELCLADHVIPAGQVVHLAVVARADAGGETPLPDMDDLMTCDPGAELVAALDGWRQWSAEGDDLSWIPDRRCRDVITASLMGIKTQQGIDGGIMAQPRSYPMAFIRDNHAAVRGLLAGGHHADAARYLRFVHRWFKRLQAQGIFPLPNAVGIGADNDDHFCGFGDESNWAAETPALYVLLVQAYVEATGDEAIVDELAESLHHAVAMQIAAGRKQEWLLPFHGDETESGGAGIALACGPRGASLVATVLAGASSHCLAAWCRQRGDQARAASYTAAADAFDTAVDQVFWNEDRGHYDWYVDGETRPQLPLTPFGILPFLFRQADRRTAHDEESVLAMAEHLAVTGHLPLQPGGLNGDFCGHAGGYLLAALSALKDARRESVYEALIRGGLTGWWGLWGEAYTGEGAPYRNTIDGRPHDLRPFESGANIEALVAYHRGPACTESDGGSR